MKTVYVCNVQTETQKEIPLEPPVMNFGKDEKKKKESSQANAGNAVELPLQTPAYNFQGAN